MKPERGNAIFTLHLESQSQYTVPCSAAKEPSQQQAEEYRDSERTHGPAKDTWQQDLKAAWKKMDTITFYLLFKNVFIFIIYGIHIIMYI